VRPANQRLCRLTNRHAPNQIQECEQVNEIRILHEPRDDQAHVGLDGRHRRLSSAWALPTFTRTPAAVGLNGSPVTADNIILSDFATVSGQRK